MDKVYAEELVSVTTKDGVPLDGAFIVSLNPRGSSTGLVWIHGGAGHFYDPTLLITARCLANRGFNSVLCNTRGHDLAAITYRDEPFVGGAAWERLDLIYHDLTAWIEYAAARGLEPIVLVGHSQGGSAAVQYATELGDRRVSGVIAVSPAVEWPNLPERVALAERMMAEGRGEELLPAREGAPPYNILSAQTLATRHRVVAKAFVSDDGAPHVARLRCPLLAIFGSKEEDAEADLKKIRANAGPGVQATTELVKGADHNYTSKEEALASRIEAWLRGLPDAKT
jgi:pimeloyl-ACP methyl ester carboxylesterase